MRRSDGLGNQQETIMNIDYVAGLFDGEGCLMIIRSRRNDIDRYNYRALIQLTNCETVIVSEYVKFVKANNLPYRVYTDDRTHLDKSQVCYQVSIGSLDGMKRWLELMIPHLVGKKAQAEILLDYVSRRILRNAEYENRRSKTGRFESGFRAAFDDADITAYESIKSMKHMGSSETTREALALSEMKI
jgi:hypothetical protein